jgi:16S rRNA processing protein RimM
MSNLQNPVLIAKVGAPHGVRGQVRVTSFTEDKTALGDYGPLSGKDGRKYCVTHARAAKNVLVVSFKEIKTRQQAESLRGVELFVERNSLPENIDENEFYLCDLIGMEAIDSQRHIIGRIQAVPNFGAGDLLEISPKLESGTFGGNSWFIAFTGTNVPDIDLDNKQVTIIRPSEISERDTESDDISDIGLGREPDGGQDGQ